MKTSWHSAATINKASTMRETVESIDRCGEGFL
jgi:hypothetical protein